MTVKQFLSSTSFIQYNESMYSKGTYDSISELEFKRDDQLITWVNTYGIHFHDEVERVAHQNHLDDFLIKLIADLEYANKVIQLDELLFLSIQVLKTETATLQSEHMYFMMSDAYIWSIQEKPGDYFGWIRERLQNHKGLVRKKKADYLLFLLLESIVDNYVQTFEKFTKEPLGGETLLDVKPTPEFTASVENRKQDLFRLKKATISLRDMTTKLEKIEMNSIETKYFTELKEQTNHLISDIDFELEVLESNMNLIFSIQGYRLNEVMKTLTIFSVIFIPLTFLAGIYGMNFKNIPELQTDNGYFVLLGIMVLITGVTVRYFTKKKWF